MGFDIPGFHVDEDSPEGRALQRIVASEGVTLEEAVRRSLRRSEFLSPAEEAIGAFSSSEDRKLLDEALSWTRAGENRWEPRELDL